MNIEGNCKMFMDFCKVNRALILLKAFVNHQCHNVPFCSCIEKTSCDNVAVSDF